VRVSEAEGDLRALDLGLVTDAVDLELTGEPVGHALDHVADQRADETVRGALRAEIARALEHEHVLALVLGLLDLDVAVLLHRQGALGPLHLDHVLGDGDRDALRDLEWLTSDTRHDSPDLAEDFAANALVPGFLVGHHALRRGDDGDAEAIADLRDIFGRHVVALAGTRHAAHAGDRIGVAAVVAKLELE